VQAFAGQGGRFLSGRRARLWSALPKTTWLTAPLVRAAFGVHAAIGAVQRAGSQRYRVTAEIAFDASYSELAERVKGQVGAWVFRDEPYLTARYGARMSTYRLLACRRGGRLIGWCLLKLRRFDNDERMGNLLMGTLVDCVFDATAPGVLDALLRAVVAASRREHVEVLFCSASLQALGRRLLRHGFVPIPGTLNIAFHDRAGCLGQTPPLDGWHLMRGDSDADANC
jgi:hypothetical protein